MRTAKFNKAALGELSADLLSPTKLIVGKFKLVNTETGISYGSSTLTHWSPAVLEKLKELQTLMEEEAENRIFEDSSDSTGAVEVGGIGEQFGNEPPSI